MVERKLDAAELKFLAAIKPEGSQASAAHMPMADRTSDKARTRLKQRGFVRFDRGEWKWFRTPAGDAALNEQEGRERGQG